MSFSTENGVLCLMKWVFVVGSLFRTNNATNIHQIIGAELCKREKLPHVSECGCNVTFCDVNCLLLTLVKAGTSTSSWFFMEMLCVHRWFSASIDCDQWSIDFLLPSYGLPPVCPPVSHPWHQQVIFLHTVTPLYPWPNPICNRCLPVPSPLSFRNNSMQTWDEDPRWQQ